MWTEKYSPKSLEEFLGNKEAVDEALKWAKNWSKEKSAKALIFFGGTGTGKTALAHIIAKELSYELLEVNPSDFNAREKLKNFLNAGMQKSLFFRGKLILIDEVDGARETGLISEIIKAVKTSPVPIIMTANDIYGPMLKDLRNVGKSIKFHKIHRMQIQKRLAEICESEQIKYDKSALGEIAYRAGGDLRAAINDLESLARKHSQITLEEVKELDSRDAEQEIFQALNIIFKSSSVKNSVQAIEGIDLDPEMIFRWIEENISAEYEKPEEISKAYNFISIADIFRARIVKRQNWKMFKYFTNLMTAGVTISKFEKYRKFTRFRFPEIVKKRASMQSKKFLINSVSSKISGFIHSSRKDVKNSLLLFSLIAKDENFKEFMKNNMDFEDAEIKFLTDLSEEF